MNSKDVLFITPYYEGARGNVTTTLRLIAGYEKKGLGVTVFPYLEGGKWEELTILLRESRYVHVLHITRFAKWLNEQNCRLDGPRFLLTMGGTDVHVDLIKKAQLDDSVHALGEAASYITFFTEEAKRVVLNLEQKWKDKLIVVPQGVLLPNSKSRVISALSTSTNSNTNSTKTSAPFIYTILLPAGLRKVKDVLHLLESWIELHRIIPQLKVIIIGEALEQEVLKEVVRISELHSFIQYEQPVPFEQMGELYRNADVVINTSIEEGQPTAIGEAMAYGIPVIVRNNAGNRSMVRHNETGFVYHYPAQFTTFIQELRNNPRKKKHMVEKAKHFIQNERGVEQEIEAYLQLFQKKNITD